MVDGNGATGAGTPGRSNGGTSSKGGSSIKAGAKLFAAVLTALAFGSGVGTWFVKNDALSLNNRQLSANLHDAEADLKKERQLVSDYEQKNADLNAKYVASADALQQWRKAYDDMKKQAQVLANNGSIFVQMNLLKQQKAEVDGFIIQERTSTLRALGSASDAQLYDLRTQDKQLSDLLLSVASKLQCEH